METNDVIKLLSSIPIGTIISWFCVIVAIIGGLSAGIIKLYKWFMKFQKTKEENDAFKQLVKKHDEQLTQISESLNNITSILEEEKKSDLKKLRHSIIRAGEEAIEMGKITIRQLRSLSELYEDYKDKYHANGYVKSLMAKVDKLPVIGKLDENDEDIEDDE